MTAATIIDKSLQSALANAPVVFWTADKAGVVQLAIGKGMARQGLTAEKVLGKSVFDLFKDYPEFTAAAHRALAGESVQFVLETFDGVFDRRLEPIRDESGAITGIVGISVDVTDQIHAQLGRQRSEEQFRDLVEGSIQGIAIVRDFRVVFANEAAASIFGFASPEAMERDFSMDKFFDEDLIREMRTSAAKHLRGEPLPRYRQAQGRRLDGSPLWIEVMARLVNWSGGLAFQLAFSDITARKLSELQLQRREEQYRDLVEGSLQGVIIRRNRRNLFANDAIARMLGYERGEDLLPLQNKDFMTPAEISRREADIALRLRGLEPPAIFEVELVHKDGGLIFCMAFRRTVQWEGETAYQITLVDITDRKRAEQALRESEWQLARAQEAGHIGTWYRDLGSELTRWSDEFYRLLGLAPGAIPASTDRFFEFVHREDIDFYLDQRGRALERDGHFSAEVRVRRADGQVRRMRILADRVDSEAGNPVALVGTMEDITDRSAAENALRESEERYRDLVEGSLQGIAIVQDMRFQFANPAYLKMYGFETLAQLQAAGPVQNRVAPHEQERLTRYSADRLAGKPIPVMYEVDSLRSDGTQFPVLAMSRMIDWNGSVAAQVTVVDVTEQRKLEQSLYLKNHAIHSANEAIAFGDLQGRFVEVNPAFAKMWGLASRQEAVGRRAIEFWWTQEDIELAADAIRKSGHWVGETVARRPNGETFPVDVRVSTVRDDKGAPVWLMASIVDITERKRTEDRQRELEEQLFQAQKMESIGRLVGGIAHDFNNMLTPMLGYAELALAALDPGDISHRYIQVIRSAAERASDLTRKMLMFGRRRPLRKSRVDIGPEIQSVVDMLKRVIHEAVIIDAQIDRDVGQIEADPALIHQLIMNLALNARDAMPQGGTLKIQARRVSLAPESNRPGDLPPGPYVRISVQDTGHGMDAEVVNRIFDPFFTTKPEGKGTGLGLSVVYGIVNQHEGQITVTSKPGAGSTFVVYLPAPAVAPEPRKAVEHALVPRQAATIFVVEDDPQVLGLVAAILGNQGYALLQANGPDEALRLMATQTTPADLLLCDVVMPKMNGPTLAKQVTRHWPGTRVLFMSGYAKDVAEEHGLHEQSATLLDKPFSVEELSRAVRRALEHP